MEDKKIEEILQLLENTSLKEWNILKECIDREFNAQLSKVTFNKREHFLASLKLNFKQ